MANFALLIVCLLLGIVLRRIGKLPAGTPQVLNNFIIYISLPALVLLNAHDMHFERSLLYPAAMAWIIFLAGALLFYLMAKLKNWDQRTVGALILTGCLGNTSFIGFPMIEALYGHSALPIGIMTDGPGSFLALSTLGIFAACACSSNNVSFSFIARRILVFPPFLALICALLTRNVSYGDVVKQTLARLSGTLVPLALVSVGFQLNLRESNLKANLGPLIAGLTYKLILGPLLIFILYAGIFGARGQVITVSIIQAAMAPMISGAILAAEYDLKPELSNLMVGIGIVLSFITVPVWAFLLRGL